MGCVFSDLPFETQPVYGISDGSHLSSLGRKSPKVTQKKIQIQVLLYTYVYIYTYILNYNIYIYTCIYILCLCHAKLQSFFRLFPRFSTMFPSCFSLDLASCRVATSCLNFSSKAKSLATGWPRNIHKLVELPIENEQKS